MEDPSTITKLGSGDYFPRYSRFLQILNPHCEYSPIDEYR